MFDLEPLLPDDPSRDFCLWDYPRRAVTRPQARMSAFLWAALNEMQAPAQWKTMLLALRAELGVGEVVWGIKQAADGISLELYFYDYQRLARTKDLARILRVLAPWLGCDLTAPAGVPWFMVSLDLDARTKVESRITALDFYLGNPGAALSAGMSYRLTDTSYTLRNIYNFFDARREGPQIRRKITESARLDLTRFNLSSLAWPAYAGAASVVVANKHAQDGLYFTRLDTRALQDFLTRFTHPQVFSTLLQSGHFDCHLFDIGIDFAMIEGEMTFPKTAFYGLL